MGSQVHPFLSYYYYGIALSVNLIDKSHPTTDESIFDLGTVSLHTKFQDRYSKRHNLKNCVTFSRPIRYKVKRALIIVSQTSVPTIVLPNHDYSSFTRQNNRVEASTEG